MRHAVSFLAVEPGASPRFLALAADDAGRALTPPRLRT